MTALTAIMDALADQLRDELESVIEGIQVEPRMNINPSPDPVALDLLTGDQEPGAFGPGNNDVMIQIRARINTADHVAAQDVLIGLIDPNGSTSLLQAVMSDTTLSSAVQNLKVEEGPTVLAIYPDASGAAAYLGFTTTVRVVP